MSQLTGVRTARAVTGGLGRGPRGRMATLSRGINCCPVPGCTNRIDPTRLMCRGHWYLVPKAVRDQVWATWRSGEGAYSREHLRVVRTAVAAAAGAGSDG